MPGQTTSSRIPREQLFRKLPSVDELARSSGLSHLISQDGQSAVNQAVRVVLAALREQITAGEVDSAGIDLAVSGLGAAVERQLRESLAYSLRAVINATGVILHTNLGRAPLSQAALEHIRETAATYSNLEFDAESGGRGRRDIHVNRLFAELLCPPPARGDAVAVEGRTQGAPAVSTIVVNNNAAAVLLALNTLAERGEVIVSRGELVEIGGSFRIPDIMSKSNAVLREVGTTNRTRIADYADAINQNTKLLLRVHRSNFQMTGFTEQASTAELSDLARTHNLPLLEDLGSGALLDLRSVGVNEEPSVRDSLQAGADVITYSGDKLLGGPQAGVLSGRSDLIARMRANSLFRALRVDKLTYAALEATLLAYIKRDHQSIPLIKMMRMSKEEIGARAEALAAEVRSANLDIAVLDGESIVGGGAAPSAVLPTKLLAITSRRLSAEEISMRLRRSNPPVVARVEQGSVLLDLRTVFLEQDQTLSGALSGIFDRTDEARSDGGRV
jgi:L-seryl-tRNA(Ser) seleniumtransferase